MDSVEWTFLKTRLFFFIKVRVPCNFYVVVNVIPFMVLLNFLQVVRRNLKLLNGLVAVKILPCVRNTFDLRQLIGIISKTG